MYLKELTMVGFKTFAEKSHIEFSPGTTAVVGPNGCGKSNVVDAVKWVLGESSAKAIRMDKMDDVIFFGSSKHKALSMAEVSLTIADFQGRGPGDEITVKRIIYRDGQNQYYLNNNRVTKSEVQKTFMDTGIGKSSYSVLEQGKMDQILSSAPEDRRRIFEEAAGISYYKFQLKETRKKLEATDSNLLRVQDILSELERELKSKRRQAEKTKKYLEIKKELDSHDLKIKYIKARKLEKKYHNLEQTLSRLLERKDVLQKNLNEEDHIKEEFEKQRSEILSSIHSAKTDIELIKASEQALASQMEKEVQALQEYKQQNRTLYPMLKNVQKELKQAQKDMAKYRQLELDLISREDNTQENLEFKKKEQQDCHNKIENYNNSITDNLQSVQKLNENEYSLRDKVQIVVKELIDAIEKKKSELKDKEQRRAFLHKEIEDKIISLKKKEKACKSLQKEADEISFENVNKADLTEKIKNYFSGLKQVLEENFSSAIATSLLNDFKEFVLFEDGFRSMFFDKEGIHAHKEELDKQIRDIIRQRKELEQENKVLASHIEAERMKQEKIRQLISRMQADLREIAARKETAANSQQSYSKQIESIKDKEDYFTQELKNLEKKIESSNEKINSLKLSSQKLKKDFQQKQKLLKDFQTQAEKLDKKMEARRENSSKEKLQLEKLYPLISEREREYMEVKINQENLWAEIYDVHEIDFQELKEKFKKKTIDIDKEQLEHKRLKESLQNMGQINPLALEEYETVKEIFEHNNAQKKDIENARDDLKTVIKDIQEKSTVQFLETFNEIRKHFSEIFVKLFVGGSGELSLIEPEKPLSSGIEIIAQPPGKKPKTLRMLSGGEKTMCAMAVLFAVFKVKSAPFCFLDEIDAPLDETNIERFAYMLQDFIGKSQFIIVTHAKKTMSMADQILGITMEEPGVSKIIGIKLEEK